MVTRPVLPRIERKSIHRAGEPGMNLKRFMGVVCGEEFHIQGDTWKHEALNDFSSQQWEICKSAANLLNISKDVIWGRKF